MLENAVNQVSSYAAAKREVTFAGDEVVLAGQIDYPDFADTISGSKPLIFILPHGGCNTREPYTHYVQLALACDYAVFRWDQRGTGRSGAGGRGSTTQDAIYAYETALEQAHVDPRHTIILAHGAGTRLLGNAFGLFARVQHPQGVILLANMLDESAILAVNTRVQIVVSDDDWQPSDQVGVAACAAHNATYRHGADYYVAPNSDRMLLDYTTTTGESGVHPGVYEAIQTWLKAIHPATGLT